MNKSDERTDQKRCCTFLIEDTCFAIESDNVTEVLQRGVINKVPLASPAISGLLNLRGRIVRQSIFGFSWSIPLPLPASSKSVS